MPDIEINASQWRLVEVGRVVLFTHGQYTGRLAVIVEIIDHKRVCYMMVCCCWDVLTKLYDRLSLTALQLKKTPQSPAMLSLYQISSLLPSSSPSYLAQPEEVQ